MVSTLFGVYLIGYFIPIIVLFWLIIITASLVLSSRDRKNPHSTFSACNSNMWHVRYTLWPQTGRGYFKPSLLYFCLFLCSIWTRNFEIQNKSSWFLNWDIKYLFLALHLKLYQWLEQNRSYKGVKVAEWELKQG